MGYIHLQTMSTYLYLDTSSEVSLIMILKDAIPISFRSNAFQKDHASLINVHIEEVMTESNINWSELNGIVVLNGPGSYTGLRIALATAKGICYARKIPLYLIHKFELLMFASPLAKREDRNGIAIKAREGEYFWAVYQRDASVEIAPKLSTKEEILQYMQKNTCSLFFIDEQVSSEIAPGNVVSIPPDRIAAYIKAHIPSINPTDLFLSEPFYLKNVHINKINKL